MHTAVPLSPWVRKVLRWIEWFLIVHTIVENVIDVDFSHSLGDYGRLGAFVIPVTLLSLRIPTDRSLTHRRLYIAAEMGLGFFAGAAQLNSSDLSSLFIIKACLLLPRRDAIIATATSCGLTIIHLKWALPTLIAEFKEKIQDVDAYLNPSRIIFETLIGTVAGSAFVVLMGFVFAAEQRSRRRAEKLAIEVETLATQLERSRIARDIHDSLGHSLTTLDVQLALAERYSQSAIDSQKLQRSLSKAKQLAAQCLAEARQSLQTMRESNFDLTAALYTLSDQMQSSFLVNLQVQVPPIPQQLSYQLYLIAKEGLVNVQKHAKATRVNLSILVVENRIVLKLIDDGCGFNTESFKAKNASIQDAKHTDNTISRLSGYGLQGIRERSQLLGGHMNLRSHPKQGVQLEVIVPLNPAHPSAPLPTATTLSG